MRPKPPFVRTGVADPAQLPMQLAAASLAVHVDLSPKVANMALAYA